ncbi:hypothetical protein O181_122524 [Austropuccinia psidii MF-1]|uniref:Tc1-like transposase DDE domain-containing protein n=1 Tax=Austropuccinia psidii MF-1 TaxID=1389203 RepID=A0A9Q3KKQ2_9BASI|nr:hypothetical protein [Austropuccinia psidii MF-1]
MLALALSLPKKLMPNNLRVEQCSQIVGMWQASLSLRTIVLRMGVPKSTVHDTIRRFQEHGTCADWPKTGRPPLLNQADRHNLDEFITHNQRANLNEISQAIPNNVSNQTISKAIHDLGKRSCIAPKKPYLCQLDFDQRLIFAQQFGHWNLQSWACIIWTDELSFELGKKADQVRVWQTPQEKYLLQNLQVNHRLGRRSLMVWGAFIGSTKGPLVFLDSTQTAETFIQKVYKPHLQPFYNYMVNAPYIRTCNCIVMMEDGTPIHTAQISNKWQATNHINKLPWPAHSPDLNPIENVWKVLKTHVTKHHQPHTMEKLCMAIQKTWDDLSPDFFEKFLIDMHK